MELGWAGLGSEQVPVDSSSLVMLRLVQPQKWIPLYVSAPLYMLKAACGSAVLGLLVSRVGTQQCPAWLVPGPVTG